MTLTHPLNLSLVALVLILALPACAAKQQKKRWQQERVQRCSPTLRLGDDPSPYWYADGLTRTCEEVK